MNRQLKIINENIKQANNIIDNINGQNFYVSRQEPHDKVTPIVVSPKKSKSIQKSLYNATLDISNYKDALQDTKYKLTHSRNESSVEK